MDETIINNVEVSNLINNLNNGTTQEDVEHILRNIPPTNGVLFRRTCFNRIRQLTPLTAEDIRSLYNEIHYPEEEEESTTTGSSYLTMSHWISRLRTRYPNKEFIQYDNRIIEMTENKIYLLTQNKSNPNTPFRDTMTGFNIKLISKCEDSKKESPTCYTFTSNKKRFYNFPVMEFLKINEYKLIDKILGTKVVKFLFDKKEETVPSKIAKHTNGYRGMWCLPFIEGNYSIKWESDEQKKVLKRCEKIYKKYTPEEKEQIIKKLKRLIEMIDMPKEYLDIIICWSIVAPFKLYFIKEFGLFPILILQGERNAGKSSIADFFITDSYGQYKEHCSGMAASSWRRFEDMITASTFPRMIDDFENVDKQTVNIIKESCTSKSDWTKKLSAKVQIYKPKVTPLCITSQDLGEEFSDTANLSRAIILDFKKSIKRNPEWMKLRNELKKKKLFSFLYDYTKDWKDKDLDELVEKVNKTIPMDKIIKKVEEVSLGMLNVDKHYPRIREIYQILSIGAYLYNEIFGIKRTLKNVFETLVSSRRNVTDEFLTQFIAFCNMAKDYEPLSHPKFLTCELYWDIAKDKFYFRQENKRDYHEFTHTKIGLEPLCRKLVEALTDKKMIYYKKVTIEAGRAEWVIVIKEKLLKI